MSFGCPCRGKHKHGASRSIVRRIGSCLPIDTGRRLFIQLPSTSDSEDENNARNAALKERLEPSLEGLTLAGYMREPTKIISKAVGLFSLDPIVEEEGERGGSAEELDVEEGRMNEDVFEMQEEDHGEQKQEETLQKITALESELARLKAQIAVYALSETQNEQNIPEAPPPPPPPMISGTPAPVQPKATKTSGELPLSGHQDCSTPQSGMSAVLKDIGSVKLRSIAKSPGGTPLRKLQECQQPASDDPAAIIAQALRKKFSHKVFQDSPDKENLDRSDMSLSAGFESPTVKLF